MNLKNRTAAVFAAFILLLIGYIIYQSLKAPVPVIIQAGHEGRTCGNTGAVCKSYKEVEWNILVADAAAKQLRQWGIKVKRVPADVLPQRAVIAVAIHFDSARRICRSGASVGYPNTNASRTFAAHWKQIYKPYFPFRWHADNFTDNLKEYYAYKTIRAEKFAVLELGEITCEKQAKWLKPRLKKIAHLIAYAIATELGKQVPKPQIPKL
jgi:N-acetylmuramoyl-L-alanine amidase